MRVRDIMTTDVKFCRPATSLAEAVKLMWEQDCGVLPVVSAERKVASMVTDREICIAPGTRGRTADRIAARDLTAGKAYTCLPFRCVTRGFSHERKPRNR
jgi:CBS domain-containing protein